jgi:hypothetical protein
MEMNVEKSKAMIISRKLSPTEVMIDEHSERMYNISTKVELHLSGRWLSGSALP